MKATTLFAAATLMLATSTGAAFAADTPVAASATSAAAAAAAATLKVPAVTITNQGGPTRAQVHAEAVEFVKNHKTALAIQLEQYKN